MAYKGAACTSEKGRAQTALTVSRTARRSWSAGLSLAVLVMLAILALVLLMLSVTLVAVALLRRRTILLWGSVGRMATVLVVPLVVIAGRGTITLLWGRIWRVRWRGVLALRCVNVCFTASSNDTYLLLLWIRAVSLVVLVMGRLAVGLLLGRIAVVALSLLLVLLIVRRLAVGAIPAVIIVATHGSYRKMLVYRERW